MSQTSPSQVAALDGSPISLSVDAAGNNLLLLDRVTGILYCSRSTTPGDWRAITISPTVGAPSLQSLTTAISISGAAAPTSGQVLTASSGTSASWVTPNNVNGVIVSGTPTNGQVLTASSGSAAAWSTPAASSNATTGSVGVIQLAGDLAGTATSPSVAKIQGVAISGTPSAGQILKATSSSAASWGTDLGSSGANYTTQNNTSLSLVRSLNTIYQNTNATSLFVSIAISIGGVNNAFAYSDPSSTPTIVMAVSGSATGYSPLTFIVPAGYYYKATCSTGTLEFWSETL
jgi:hypothetical protein